MELLHSQPEVSMLLTWRNTPTFSDWLVAPDGVIPRSDSEEAPPSSPKSVSGSSTFPLVSSRPSSTFGTVGSELPEPSDSGYSNSNSIRSYATITRLNAISGSRHLSGLSTPTMAGNSVSTYSTISIPSLPSTDFLPASPLERDADGNPTLQTPPQVISYPCAFGFLDCPFADSCKSTWLSHNRAHFKTKQPPPTAVCPFCHRAFNSNAQAGTAYGGSAGAAAWEQSMECLASHIEEGATLARPWKDIELYSYMWRNRLITNDEYRELVQDGRVRRGIPVIEFEKRDRGRRQRR